MLNEVAYLLKLISTFSVLLPIAVGLWYLKQYGFVVKWFIAFLGIGLVTDMGGWIFYLIKNDAANLYTRHAYALFDSLFLFWLLGRLSPEGLVKSFLNKAWIVLVPFWLVRFYYLPAMSIFKTSTQVFIAFAACFIILRRVEASTSATRQLTFWILLGVFFYCFSTYFIMGMLATSLSKIWYSQNLINIVTNLIYFVGFFKFSTQQEQEGSSSLS